VQTASQQQLKLLKQGLSELAITPEENILTSFSVYSSELKKWNRAYNLTSITDDREIIIKHFFDSLLYLHAMPNDIQTLCDVGSGAGLPGIPLAIVRPDLQITLIEPSRKRCAFLRHITHRLTLKNVNVAESTAESADLGQFDLAVTRATFTIQDLLKKAEHLLKPGGWLLLSKGPKYKDELLSLPQSYISEVFDISLPELFIVRHLIRIKIP
jgi:16S rRNA (guanine527-N7)-methyltransferase